MSTSNSRSPIRLGVDMGSLAFRAAYLHPRPEHAVVPVPFPMDRLPPIIEPHPFSGIYTSRFSPALVQRLEPGVMLNMSGGPIDTGMLMTHHLSHVCTAAETFAGRSIEALLVCHPIWATEHTKKALERAIVRGSTSAVMTVLRSEAEAVCASFRASDLAKRQDGAIVLLSAGYTGAGVAVAHLSADGVRVLREAGDQAVLAGNVLDFAIQQSAIKRLEAERLPFANVGSPPVWAELQFGAEKAKHAIKDAPFTDFELPPQITPGMLAKVRVRLHGPAFRDLVASHVDKAMRLVDDLLRDAGVKPEAVSHVLLHGGTTHLPDVTRRMRAAFPSSEVSHLPPDAVAVGAALLLSEDSVLESGDAELAGARRGDFYPDVAEVPGLITVERALREGPRSPAASYPDPEEPAVERLTLAELRACAANGDVTRAREGLWRLHDAVLQEIRKLD